MTTTNFTTGLSDWVTSIGTETFAASDGNPTGSIRGVEGGTGVWYYVAPDAYLGNRGAFYGGSLSFDLRQDITTSQFDDNDVVLTGGGLTLALDVGANPGTDWTSYSVNLSLGGGWKIGSINGRVATEDEIRNVLGDLQSLEIRGEYVNGTTGDASNLDNVAMLKTPATPTDYIGPKVKSGFDADTEGWSFIADVKEFTWEAVGGNPGGYLEAVDFTTGQVWYFVAPAIYLGNKSAYAGGTLQFDLKQSGTGSQFDEDDVVLAGGGLTIVLNTASNPGVDWTHYSVDLDTASDWRIGTTTGEVATQAQINTVLGDLTALHIRGEFISGSDTGGLDNVAMTASNAAVRVLSDSSTGALLSNHAFLGDALAVTEPGNVVLVNNVSAVSQPSYDVADNGLTIVSNKPLDATLKLDGVRTITLSGDNDLNVDGNAKNNLITGSDGDNLLRGRGGDDTLKGGAGKDSLIGGNGRDSLSGGDGKDTLRGNIGRDSLLGNKGADKLFGGNGNDTLKGGNGNDLLSGDSGADVLIGNGGSDVFRFKDGFDTDTITGFEALNDAEKIDLSRVTSVIGFFDLKTNHMVQSGADVVIDALGGDTITLVNISLADLTAVDFVF
ncbi:MAG: hypothetical protein ACI8R4_001778 [Paracoccaceae bacterium]|jgi:hypothetical protein